MKWCKPVAARAAGLGLLGAAALALDTLDGPILCPFRRCTGGYCPLCGVTRSVAAVLRADLPAAFRLYPALPILVLMVPLVLWPDRFASTRRWVLGTAAVVLVWAVRLALGDIPAPSELTWPLPWPRH